ncbi:XRE family transcriptional regulator [Nocardia sp. NPDC050413]|uniref:XRE family transcriptional regulator n=1 Tax=Nocardia sp. NPDC050413 TaxID=3155784 RepID=UPI0033F93C89
MLGPVVSASIGGVNVRLQTVLHQRGIEPESLADVCEVDPKTVGRWLGGRVPHPRHRRRVAHHLRVEEGFLWPPEVDDRASTNVELVATYHNRAEVPRETWLTLLGNATEQIDVLVFSGTFFAQSNPRVAQTLIERAREGARVRLCFGDPGCKAVLERGIEEGLGPDTLAAKIRASLTYYRSLVTAQRCEVRLHGTTLYNSMFRYDDTLLVNPHIWGQPASANPVFQLKRVNEVGWFDNYAESFDAIWADAQPWIPD